MSTWKISRAAVAPDAETAATAFLQALNVMTSRNACWGFKRHDIMAAIRSASAAIVLDGLRPTASGTIAPSAT